MANSFKSDESFLRKLAIGAAGTNYCIDRLTEMGFHPIELERGSTGFKIWKKIKIKRVRVPDILCLNTGLRFESRGKTNLEISMSHSLSDPNRAWDAGMRDDDYVSVILFKQSIDDPIDIQRISPVHFVRVSDMRLAFANDQVSITKPKGVEEGSEIRVLWTSATANRESIVTSIDSSRIRLESIPDSRRQTIQLRRANGRIILNPQVNQGDMVESKQIVASVLPVYTSLELPPLVDEDYFIDKLASVNLSERYAAAKALRYRGYVHAKSALESRLSDAEEDIYVQLESAAALAAYEDSQGWDFIRSKLQSTVFTVPLETQLETIIVASEIPNENSEHLLIDVLRDSDRNEELRAGAAWALGQFASSACANALIDTFNLSSLEVKCEAARALLRIAEPQVSYLVDILKTADPSKRDGLSWVLAKTGSFDPSALLIEADDDLRRWMSYIVGFGKDNFIESDLQAISQSDPEVYFAASVLWQILSSWVNNLTEY